MFAEDQEGTIRDKPEYIDKKSKPLFWFMPPETKYFESKHVETGFRCVQKHFLQLKINLIIKK